MVRILGTLLLVLAMHGHLQADVVIAAPTGLAVGQQFRIMVVTTGTTQATSTDISTYNTFVASDTANTNYTYNGVTVAFSAWGSTATVNAKDNIGWTTGNQTNVYRSTGVLISTAAAFLTANHAAGVTDVPSNYIWTGTGIDGNRAQELAYNEPSLGLSGNSNNGWTNVASAQKSTAYQMYGISGVLTVVPEPGTFILCGMSTTVLAAMMFFRWRREQRERLRLAAVSAE